MILRCNRAITTHLRHCTRKTINAYTKTSTSRTINMDSGNNQQKKDEGEKQFSIQPINEGGAVDAKFAAHKAHPGPAITQNMPSEEGTKEERQARKEDLNK